MATITWSAPDAAESLMTTELNAVASSANAITGTAVSNDAAGELDLYATFELYLATQGGNRAAGARVDMYFLPEIDGSNYSFGGASLDPSPSSFAGTFQLDAGVTTARYTLLTMVPLPPHDFHIVLINETGQALAATGNTLKMSRYNMASA